jgi:hypothetical protein
MGAEAHPQTQALTSWKEIAAYLGKGVRTVQRWEIDFGLPVRRPSGREKGIVYALPQELDHWLATRWSQRLGPTLVAVAPKPTPGWEHIQAARQLRDEHRQLVEKMRRTVQDLVGCCQTLALLIAQSRNWRTRSGFPILEGRVPSSPRRQYRRAVLSASFTSPSPSWRLAPVVQHGGRSRPRERDSSLTA